MTTKGIFANQSKTCQIQNLAEIYEKFFSERRDGIFVDVGAYDGIMWSNTWGLAEIGWSGICIEPNPIHAKKCRENHLIHDPRIETIEVCAGAYNGETTMYMDNTSSTINLETVERSPWGFKYNKDWTMKRPVRTLNLILSEYLDDLYDFEVLSIDVEGAELEVLQGLDLLIWNPKILIIETHKGNENSLLAFHADDTDAIVMQYGYKELQFDSTNSVYYRGE